jgi:perosamine synthetase
MVSILLGEEYPLERDALILALREAGIDSRPFFHPIDTLPPYYSPTPCPVSLDLSRRGLNLPSSPHLTEGQVGRICSVIRRIAQSHG